MTSVMKHLLIVSMLFVLAVCASNMSKQDNTKSCAALTKFTHILQLGQTVANLYTELRSIASEQASMKSALRDKDTLLANITRSLAQATDVTYSVSLQSDVRQEARKPLTFDTVDYNQGNGYKRANGMFTAPMSGSYVFWANVMSKGLSPVRLNIFKGGTMIGRGYVTNQAHGVASITTATYLGQGDQVWMNVDVSSRVMSLRGNKYSSYGGTLIHAH